MKSLNAVVAFVLLVSFDYAREPHAVEVTFPETSIDALAILVNYYKSDEKGYLIYVYKGNCYQGPRIKEKIVKDNILTIITETQNWDAEMEGYMIVDDQLSCIKMGKMTKLWKKDESLKITTTVTKFEEPKLVKIPAKYRFKCINGECRKY